MSHAAAGAPDAPSDDVTGNAFPGWQERVYAAFSAILENNDTLTAEMGERAAAAAAAEAMLTVQIKPYPRRIMAVASRPATCSSALTTEET